MTGVYGLYVERRQVEGGHKVGTDDKTTGYIDSPIQLRTD
jgi:hypothetical protein